MPRRARLDQATAGLREDALDLAYDDNNAKRVTTAMRARGEAAKAHIDSGKIKVVDFTAAMACR